MGDFLCLCLAPPPVPDFRGRKLAGKFFSKSCFRTPRPQFPQRAFSKVANGHYSKPSYGGFGTESEIKQKFEGNVIHSHNYRSPEQSGFEPGQTVVVIGASASALDISVELAKYAIVMKIGYFKK